MEQREFVGDGRRGSINIRPVLPEYREFILSNFKFSRSFKIVVDGGNGCGGIVAASLVA